MAIYTFIEGELARIDVTLLRSLPAVVFSFETSSALQKSKSKIMAAVRQIVKVPTRKIVISITPNRYKYSASYMESALASAIMMACRPPTTMPNYVIAGEMDVHGNILPLTLCEYTELLYASYRSAIQHELVLHADSCSSAIPPARPAFSCNSLYEVQQLLLGRFHKRFTPRCAPASAVLNCLPTAGTLTNDLVQEQLFHCCTGFFPTLIMSNSNSLAHQTIANIQQLLPEPLPIEKIIMHRQEPRWTEFKIKLENDRPVYTWQPGDTAAHFMKVLPCMPYGIIYIPHIEQQSLAQLQQLWHYLSAFQPMNSLNSMPIYYLMLATISPCPCGKLYSNTPCTCHTTTLTNYQHNIFEQIIQYFDIMIDLTSRKNTENTHNQPWEKTKRSIQDFFDKQARQNRIPFAWRNISNWEATQPSDHAEEIPNGTYRLACNIAAHKGHNTTTGNDITTAQYWKDSGV